MKRIKMIITGIFFTLFIAGTVTAQDSNLDEFAKCLADKGFKMYGSDSCSHCISQKELFGESFRYIEYTECNKNKEICREEGIQAYPTWVSKDGRQQYKGTRPLQNLSDLSGCPLSE